MVNKVMILIHIVAYLVIIIVDVLSYVVNDSVRAYEIYFMCDLAVYSVCTVIFGVIVN